MKGRLLSLTPINGISPAKRDKFVNEFASWGKQILTTNKFTKLFLARAPLNGISALTKLFSARKGQETVSNLLKAQKIISNLLIIIAWGFFVPFADPVAQGAEFNKKSLADSHPIEISADRLEAYDAKKVVLFSGNAVATQGDRVIKAEKIFLYYKKEERESGREGLRDIGKAGDLERIEAKGHVSVSQGDRLVTGDQAVYYQDSQKIVMTGNAVMQQGINIVRGDKIEVFLNENRGVVEAAENKRVKATIYPVEKK